jgi:D-proline reductase (dithiol) PrdB
MGFPPYEWTIHDTAPLTRLQKPLEQCRVSMLTSGGISHCSMPGFDPDARNDHRLDTVPQDVNSGDFDINDSYYNHTDAEKDLNCVFPIDRLRELADAGVIGSVAPRFWSGFMGRIYNRTKVLTESAPAFVKQLKEDAVDILVAAPA